MRVKVCGITREEDISVAVDAGVDAVGFICGFPESPRNLSPARAEELVSQVPFFVDSVLVTKAGLISKSPGMVRKIRPTVLQLYGRRGSASRLARRFGLKLILAEPFIGGGLRVEGPDGFDALLPDTHGMQKFAGLGETRFWEACRAAREVVSPKPFVLSGGLDPQNVRRAVVMVDPYGVDVSSGVESAPGVKDRMKVQAFVEAARSAS